jgi:hypothetical protein
LPGCAQLRGIAGRWDSCHGAGIASRPLPSARNPYLSGFGCRSEVAPWAVQDARYCVTTKVAFHSDEAGSSQDNQRITACYQLYMCIAK